MAHSTYKGFWSLICDDDDASSTSSTEIGTISELLKKMQTKYPELFPIPPKATKFYGKDKLLVFTSNNTFEQIKRSVETIRSNVYFPFTMYYFEKHSSDSKDTKLQYMNTPGNELYRYCYKDHSEASFWKHISKNEKRSVVTDELLPSQVTDRNHIHLPTNDEDFEKVKNDKGGKWILFCTDLQTLDNYWKNLIRLYDKKILAGLKTCTAKFSVTEYFPDYENRAIMCYTSDAGCISCVKRAAESISICTGYDFVMFYKSNKASRFGQFRHEGFTSIPMYMFTVTGEMLQKDYLNRWETCIFSE